jgi:hypothetical protein
MAYPWTPILTLSLFTCFAAGCASGTAAGLADEEGPGLQLAAPILTDQSVYTAQRGATYLNDGTLYGRYVQLVMRLRYTNSTAGPIYLPTCHTVHPPVLERKQDSGWVTAYAPIVQLCLGPPEIIERGRTFEYLYHIQAFLPGSRVMPQFQTAVAGTYRLVWGAYATWTGLGSEPGLGRELPLKARISNEFDIVE